MKSSKPANLLPLIPDKRYFTIGEVSELCAVKPHVLRYWEQEFSPLRPSKRKGSRRYYQRKDILIIRKIRELLYDKGFTISGARQQLKFVTLSEDELTIKSEVSEAFDVKQPQVIEQSTVELVQPEILAQQQEEKPLSIAVPEFLKQLIPVMRQDLESLLTELKA